MAVFFTSDTHFGDPRVLRIDRRPFPTLRAHDEALVALWNETVRPEDTVWHLGDFASGRAAESALAILRSLHGEKHLIIGNNDPPAIVAAADWRSTASYAELALGPRRLVLCHYPFRTWNSMGRGVIDLHGHSHGRLTPVPRQYDVGVDLWDFRPVTLEAILARRRRARPRPGPRAG
jgi:calcineurin-like phosphoesterase family protein